MASSGGNCWASFQEFSYQWRTSGIPCQSRYGEATHLHEKTERPGCNVLSRQLLDNCWTRGVVLPFGLERNLQETTAGHVKWHCSSQEIYSFCNPTTLLKQNLSTSAVHAVMGHTSYSTAPASDLALGSVSSMGCTIDHQL